GDMLRDRRRRHHVDRVPGAPALTERAANAALQVDIDKALQGWLIHPRQLVDTIDRADFDTGFTACAIVRTNDREFLGEFLARLACTLCHGRSRFRIEGDELEDILAPCSGRITCIIRLPPRKNQLPPGSRLT